MPEPNIQIFFFFYLESPGVEPLYLHFKDSSVMLICTLGHKPLVANRMNYESCIYVIRLWKIAGEEGDDGKASGQR